MRLLREDRPGDRGHDPAGDPGPGQDERARVRCRVCATDVADPADRLDLGQGPEVYVNPHGFAHELVLFSSATNVAPLGAPTGEFTWFAGYTWRHMLCAGCQHHLGWIYEAVDDRSPATFFGFRSAEIA